uniref:Autophagy-related protein n=1 Tax=Trichomonas gallinae TaxID=56777 RepID=A0AA96MQC1_9EUKA|nr:autophagy-related protein 8 [Trichomonas gallinae]
MFSSKNESRYKREKTFEERQAESANIIRKYKSHVPVIVDKDPKCTLPDIERQKFLVPSELSIGQFVYVVRKRINLQSASAIFLFVNKKLPPPNSTMGVLYEENRDEDGFMYCLYSSDNSFGSQ